LIQGGQTEQSARARSPDLVLAGIYKAFGGVHAVDGANLESFAGEVHGLVGENGAGKSTLIKILSGAFAADAGEITFHGDPLQPRSPADAAKSGIGTVFQELSLIPHLSVAQNLFYGNEPRVRLGRINSRALRSAAREALAQYGFPRIRPGSFVSQLRLADRQILEIVKVLIRDPHVLVLDEPTSALLPEQVQWLFATVREFAAKGRIVIFISHRLAEIEALCDRVTVLRNGKDVGHGPMAEMPEEKLVELMLGRKIERVFPQSDRSSRVQDEIVCELEDFGSPPRLRDINFKIRRGEIVGVGGLAGQGQGDLFLAMFGARRSHGRAVVSGRQVHPRTPSQALASGIALVPEDRASEGLCLALSVRDNISLGNLGSVSSGSLISARRERRLVRAAIESLHITLRHPRQEANSLSGGNQQKVLLGRVLAGKPDLLLMYDATRGVDVGTKSELYQLMHEQCARGVGILFYSTDAAELANMADEVIVLHDGTIRARLSGADLTEERIIAAAVGGGGRVEAVA
jgi:ribose transport system ATP-binding protein